MMMAMWVSVSGGPRSRRRRGGRGGGGWGGGGRRQRFSHRVVVAYVPEAGERRAEADSGARGALDGLLELEEDAGGEATNKKKG